MVLASLHHAEILRLLQGGLPLDEVIVGLNDIAAQTTERTLKIYLDEACKTLRSPILAEMRAKKFDLAEVRACKLLIDYCRRSGSA